jgi:hypothetical protein
VDFAVASIGLGRNGEKVESEQCGVGFPEKWIGAVQSGSKKQINGPNPWVQPTLALWFGQRHSIDRPPSSDPLLLIPLFFPMAAARPHF